MNMSLLTIPKEILLVIAGKCNYKSIINLSRTCSYLFKQLRTYNPVSCSNINTITYLQDKKLYHVFYDRYQMKPRLSALCVDIPFELGSETAIYHEDRIRGAYLLVAGIYLLTTINNIYRVRVFFPLIDDVSDNITETSDECQLHYDFSFPSLSNAIQVTADIMNVEQYNKFVNYLESM